MRELTINEQTADDEQPEYPISRFRRVTAAEKIGRGEAVVVKKGLVFRLVLSSGETDEPHSTV